MQLAIGTCWIAFGPMVLVSSCVTSCTGSLRRVAMFESEIFHEHVNMSGIVLLHHAFFLQRTLLFKALMLPVDS